jgi:hypothetical protein
MPTPEGRVKAKLRRHLRNLPRCYVFMPVQSGLGASTLDYLICVNGWFVAIETKKPGGKMTPRQEIVAQQIRDAGGRVYMVDSDAALDAAMEELFKLPHLTGGPHGQHRLNTP